MRHLFNGDGVLHFLHHTYEKTLCNKPIKGIEYKDQRYRDPYNTTFAEHPNLCEDCKDTWELRKALNELDMMTL